MLFLVIGVTVTGLFGFRTQDGAYIRRAKLAITGLTAAADNSVPHTLKQADGVTAAIPLSVTLVPGSAGLWGEKQAADGTNIYIHVDTAGATAGTALVDY